MATLRITLSGLMPFRNNGGRTLTIRGEFDPSISPGSPVHFHESVRLIMYSNMNGNASGDALGDWCRLILVPGTGAPA